jgi:hypothetical protein
MNDEAPARRRRAGGRRGHSDRAGGPPQSRRCHGASLSNTDKPTEPLDEEGIATIHRGAMRILSEIGIEFLNDEAVGYLKDAGCIVEGQTVRFDPAFVEEMVARAPVRVHDGPAQTRKEHCPWAATTCSVRQCLLPAECVGSGSRQAARGFRDLQGIHQAHAVFQLHPFRRRLPGGAHRHPPQRPAPRLPLREADTDRQGGACLQPRRGAGRRRDGDGAHRRRPHP